MQNYIREKYRHLFNNMETLDNEYYFKVLSKEESDRIENAFFTKDGEIKDFVYRQSRDNPGGRIQDKLNIKDRLSIQSELAAFPEFVVVLLYVNIEYAIRARILVVIPAKTELKGKYLRAHLRRRVPVEGYYGGELIELYPVLIKADTMKKDDFIPLFDMYQEQSFERLFKFMDIYWHKPYDQNVIQELYEKRNPDLFSEYEIADNIWAKFLESGREESPNMIDILKNVLTKKLKIKLTKKEKIK